MVVIYTMVMSTTKLLKLYLIIVLMPDIFCIFTKRLIAFSDCGELRLTKSMKSMCVFGLNSFLIDSFSILNNCNVLISSNYFPYIVFNIFDLGHTGWFWT